MQENIIKETGRALHNITSSERGTFILFILFALGSVIFSIVYFTDNINQIVKDHNSAIAEQRREFLGALKDLSK